MKPMPDGSNPFYEALSAFYDSLFPLEYTILNFLKSVFEGRSRILDVACGTGTYTLPLLEEGKQIVGVDLDPAMIQKAREKLTSLFGSQEPLRDDQGTLGDTRQDTPTYRIGRTSPRFFAEDMRFLSSFTEGSFEGIYCIGNSLAHLETLQEIQQTLHRFAQLLEPGGILLIQIVNFDRVTFQREPQHLLPGLRGEGVELSRKYTPGPDPDHVYFETELRAEGKILKNSLPLYRLTSGELQRMLQNAGFEDMGWYGSYEGTSYDPSSSFLLITTAVRSNPF